MLSVHVFVLGNYTGIRKLQIQNVKWNRVLLFISLVFHNISNNRIVCIYRRTTNGRIGSSPSGTRALDLTIASAANIATAYAK